MNSMNQVLIFLVCLLLYAPLVVAQAPQLAKTGRDASSRELTIIHTHSLSRRPRLRERLFGLARICMLGLLVASAAIFASPGRARTQQILANY